MALMFPGRFIVTYVVTALSDSNRRDATVSEYLKAPTCRDAISSDYLGPIRHAWHADGGKPAFGIRDRLRVPTTVPRAVRGWCRCPP